jgi:hypothetical protein
MVIEALLTLRETTDDYEVTVIHDGSKDHTSQFLGEQARIYPDEVRVVHHAKNRG